MCGENNLDQYNVSICFVVIKIVLKYAINSNKLHKHTKNVAGEDSVDGLRQFQPADLHAPSNVR